MMRYNIIQSLIDKNQYKSYLEIGVEGRETFDRIRIDHKEGVDPAGNCTHKMTSDEFFGSLEASQQWSLIFIDGLHLKEQVIRDINNSLNHLSSNGIIVVHDCLPETERQQLDHVLYGEPWMGDVWKAMVELSYRPDLLIYTVNTDYGCGLIQKIIPSEDRIKDIACRKIYIQDHIGELTYNHFLLNKQLLLNVISIDEFKRKFLI